jgi:hypothetical protein
MGSGDPALDGRAAVSVSVEEQLHPVMHAQGGRSSAERTLSLGPTSPPQCTASSSHSWAGPHLLLEGAGHVQ